MILKILGRKEKEMIARAINAVTSSILCNLEASKTAVNMAAFRLTFPDRDREVRRRGEGAELPEKFSFVLLT
jgi:hypothetical protein